MFEYSIVTRCSLHLLKYIYIVVNTVVAKENVDWMYIGNVID